MSELYTKYATEQYVDNNLNIGLETKADAEHNHDSSYDVKGAADAALNSAKEYVDAIAAGLATEDYVDDGLEAKADAEHTHSASNITSGTLSSDRLPTVPVSKGGTGATEFTAGRALISNGTDAFTTRSITDHTDTTGILTASNNLITQNTLKNALNRSSSVASSNTNYDTYMVRGESLNSAETTPPQNGQIAWTYA